MRTALGWGCVGLTLRVQQAGQTQVLLGCAEGSLQVVVGIGLGEFAEVHEIRPVQGIEGEGSRQAPVPGAKISSKPHQGEDRGFVGIRRELGSSWVVVKAVPGLVGSDSLCPPRGVSLQSLDGHGAMTETCSHSGQTPSFLSVSLSNLRKCRS